MCIAKRQRFSGGGVKIVTRYPESTPSLKSELIIFDSKTGERLALMDATWITAMRTGAVAAHTIRLLAKEDYSRIGIIGLGNTARAALLMLLENETNKDFEIHLLKYKNQEISFAERFKTYRNIKLNYVDNVEDLVKQSEVVISAATYLKDDICSDACFNEGVLVVPIHTRGFTNCDLFFDKVFADDTGHVCHFKNFALFKNYSEISDVVNGTAKGRENNKERIIAYNIGISLHDIYYASKIYEMCISKNIGLDVDMYIPSNKFWL